MYLGNVGQSQKKLLLISCWKWFAEPFSLISHTKEFNNFKIVNYEFYSCWFLYLECFFSVSCFHWYIITVFLLQEKDGLRLESITERIVLITFDNKMTPQVVNASQTEITRLCNISQSWQCQPSVHSNTGLFVFFFSVIRGIL